MTELQITVHPALLMKVSQKYHYMEQDMETLCQVAEQMNHALRGRCGFWSDHVDTGADHTMTINVVMTLGSGIDKLQENYTTLGNFVECYMTEVIAEELLLEAYVAFNEWVAANTYLHVKRYHFCGDGMSLPLKQMRKILASSACDAVSYNEAYCLTPKKSVVFRAELTTDACMICEGICAGCNKMLSCHAHQANG